MGMGMNESPQRRIYFLLKEFGPSTWKDIRDRSHLDGKRMGGAMYDGMDAMIGRGDVRWEGTQRNRVFWLRPEAPEPENVKRGKGQNPKSQANLKFGPKAMVEKRIERVSRYKPLDLCGAGKIALEECWPL